MPRTRPPYPEEFRREAIRAGPAGREAVSASSRRIWGSLKSRCATGSSRRRPSGESAPGLSDDEREELQQLRNENAKLRMEREILKKAAVFFAKETDGR